MTKSGNVILLNITCFITVRRFLLLKRDVRRLTNRAFDVAERISIQSNRRSTIARQSRQSERSSRQWFVYQCVLVHESFLQHCLGSF